MTDLPGMVVSGYGGFYQVRLADGDIIDCKPRGRLKKEFSKIYSGDKVTVSPGPDNTGMIESIAPRRLLLPRPNIANVDRIIIVLAWTMPDFDLLLADRLLVIAQRIGIAPLICFNKMDLLTKDREKEFLTIKAAYEQAGFPVFSVSAACDQGIDSLRRVMDEGITVFAGQSGVGKSSLLNRLLPDENAQVGVVSDRLRRGKHTTRYTRILPLDEKGKGFIADTPGFFTLDLPDDLPLSQLPLWYPEFRKLPPCRFDGCLHDKEPDCQVKEAVAEGRIDMGRYQRYLRLLQEIREREEVRYR